MTVQQLLPQLYFVKLGFPQVYIWQDGSELTLVDTGFPGSGPELAQAFAELGLRRSDLRRVVLTHYHEDHAGGVADVRQWGDVEVLVHRGDAPFVRGDRRPPARHMASKAERDLFEELSAGIPPAPPCAVDVELSDGDVIGFGGGAEVVSGAGHTGGSIGLFMHCDGVLFTGDLIVNSEAGPQLGLFNDDQQLAQESFVKMAALPARIVCFGHGDPLSDADAWSAFGSRVHY